MKTSVYILMKYWKKHKKNLMSLIFSAVLLTAITLVYWLVEREIQNRYFEENIYSDGVEELIIFNSNDELRSIVLKENKRIKSASAYKFGDFDDFAFGTVDDPHNIMRITLESGRLPAAENEVSVDRAVLNALYWTGKTGDKISFDNKEYTVTGIMDISRRDGSTLGVNSVYNLLDGHDMPECRTLPLILFSELKGSPQARIDYFSGIVSKKLTTEQAESSPEYMRILDALSEKLDYDKSSFVANFVGAGTIGGNLSTFSKHTADFYNLLFFAGGAVAVLSVFTVIRTIFHERQSNIAILKNIGMSRKKRLGMYAAECAALSVTATLVGFLAGTIVYLIILAVKVLFLGETNISGFTADYYITSRSVDPFIFSGVFSVSIMILAYFLNLVTVKIKLKMLGKNARPRGLTRCLNRVFRGGATSFIQCACLVIICVSTVFSYMYYTINGKHVQSIMLGTPVSQLYAGGIDMQESNVAEYYFCTPPHITGVGNIDNLSGQFSVTQTDFDSGFDDGLANTFPEYAFAAGFLEQPFIISEEIDNDLENHIDFSIPQTRELLLTYSTEEYQNFFDEGQIGSKNLYRAPTCLSDEKAINKLMEYVCEGEINIEKINAGEEILVVSTKNIPSFTAEETYVFASALCGEETYGISGINVSEPVKIGAVIRIPDSADPLLKRLTANDETQYNFLTTAAGAEKMGLHNARYTDVFAAEEMDGSIFPSEAKMTMISIKQLKTQDFLKRLKNAVGIIMTLIVMSLLGFSAYFNGIAMKIRKSSYQISVLRAQGASVSKIKKVLLYKNLKIPFLAMIFSYIALKAAQMSANSLCDKWDELWMSGDEFVEKLSETIFMRNNWWQTNLEIPTLILLAVFSAITLILTVTSMRKFKGDIASDLNSGRTRQ
ncbi:MAG: ABC transporter permease [Ruminococcaceae bacterium]|nr:ABC transporter permease [Oscillospiraceae bacterium]